MPGECPRTLTSVRVGIFVVMTCAAVDARRRDACSVFQLTVLSAIPYTATPNTLNAKIAQRIFKFSDTHYISLTPDKELNSLIYRTLFYVNIYESYKLSKIVCIYKIFKLIFKCCIIYGKKS